MLYDQDFYRWTQAQAELLRAGRVQEADLAHIAEEIEDMGKRDRRELRGHLAVLLMHLLKYRIQPAKRSKSWRKTIDRQRLDIEDVLNDSPSLRTCLHETVTEAWRGALRLAARETGRPKNELPQTCPFTLEQILDEDYLPQ